jgi:hypothetical protein
MLWRTCSDSAVLRSAKNHFGPRLPYRPPLTSRSYSAVSTYLCNLFGMDRKHRSDLPDCVACGANIRLTSIVHAYALPDAFEILIYIVRHSSRSVLPKGLENDS